MTILRALSAATVCVSVVVAGGLAASSVQAEGVDRNCHVGGSQTVCVFNFVGYAENWQVPAGVTSIDVVLGGAQGGSPGWKGGFGGSVHAHFAVEAGQTYAINVGGKGAEDHAIGWNSGGYNGGGIGKGPMWTSGGGGGGASDVSIGGKKIAIAGGGGGSGRGLIWTATGGAGGGLIGEGGQPDNDGGGGPGGQVAGGGSGGGHATGGGQYQGGDGSWISAGGGGGGYYGGGGGDNYSGGGGGSSWVDKERDPAPKMEQGKWSKNGQVKIFYTPSAS